MLLKVIKRLDLSFSKDLKKAIVKIDYDDPAKVGYHNYSQFEARRFSFYFLISN